MQSHIRLYEPADGGDVFDADWVLGETNPRLGLELPRYIVGSPSIGVLH